MYMWKLFAYKKNFAHGKIKRKEVHGKKEKKTMSREERKSTILSRNEKIPLWKQLVLGELHAGVQIDFEQRSCC